MKRRGKRPITPCLIALYEEGMAAHGRGLTETDNPYEGTKRPKRSPEIAISCTFATS